jgi:regulatory protein
LARAQAVWQKKFGQLATSGPERNKQARFLASRGFSGEVVRQVVAGIADD